MATWKMRPPSDDCDKGHNVQVHLAGIGRNYEDRSLMFSQIHSRLGPTSLFKINKHERSTPHIDWFQRVIVGHVPHQVISMWMHMYNYC